MSALKTTLRRLRTLLWTSFSIVVIAYAALIGVGKLLMPYSEHYQPELEQWLSREFGRQVSIDSFSGDWTAFGPRLSLQGMRLMPVGELRDSADVEAAAVAVSAAELDIKPLNYFLPGRSLYDFRIIGADFELLQTVDGRLLLSGLGVNNRGDGSPTVLGELAQVGQVHLQDSSLTYRDIGRDVTLSFGDIQGRVHLEGTDISLAFTASLQDARGGLIYGDIEGTLLMRIDEQQKPLRADWQLTTRELMLAALQGRLPSNPLLPLTGWLNAEIWGHWTPEEGIDLRGVSDLREARLVNAHQDLRLNQLNTRFRWLHQGPRAWQLHLANLLYDDGVSSWVSPRISIARQTGQDLGLWISADELPLDAPFNIARDVMLLYDTPWPANLPGAVSGVVRNLDLALDTGWGVRHLSAVFEDGSVYDWADQPALYGLRGSLRMDSAGGMLSLGATQLVVDWPRMFRDRLQFELAPCRVDFSPGEEWQVSFQRCALYNQDLEALADITVRANGGRPAVDVNASILRGDIGQFDGYWPEAVMSENVKTWLRRALVDGDLVSGRVQIFGDLDDWPFRRGTGRFEAVARVQNGHLDYYEGWPAARELEAVARFVGASMDVRGSTGNVGGAKVEEAWAVIEDMALPRLRIGYTGREQLPVLLEFLRQSPVNAQIGADLTQFEFRGDVVTTGLIDIPMGSLPGEFSLAGQADVSAASFHDPQSDVLLEKISGRIDYSQDGIKGESLVAEFREHEASLDLLANRHLREKFRAQMSGLFDVHDVIPPFLREDFHELDRVAGECLWEVSLVVAPGAVEDEYETVLEVSSQLMGVGLDLPAPLNKPEGAAWPLRLRLPLAGAEPRLDIEFSDRLSLDFRLSDDFRTPLSALVSLGGGHSSLPDQGLIRIEGITHSLDLDGWLDIIVDAAHQDRGMGRLELEQGELYADELLFMDRSFRRVEMDFDVSGSDIRSEFNGDGIVGRVRFTPTDSGLNSLTAEFERLALGEPVNDGMDTTANPANLPAVHLYARSFQYVGLELGETRIEAYPTASGYHFEKVEASSEQISLQASGDWTLGDDGPRSEFVINMTSESLGSLLEQLDISSSMAGGQTILRFNAWWRGTPASFALPVLNGEIEFSVTGGNISNASAGGGRLLGLLSVQALPRRLALDFRDVFDSGFSFDSATGTFRMENGMARTDDVLLRSSAANITVSGSTNLVDRQYDQVMTIQPGVGNTLPIIGALAAGPPGAAAGLALQGLLQKPLAEATQVQYSITGSWDSPELEPIDVTPVTRPSEEDTPKDSDEQPSATG